MADTLRASEEGIQRIDQARQRKRWNRTADAWLQAIPAARSTMNRFWSRQPVRREIFIGICDAVGIPWGEVVDPILQEGFENNSWGIALAQPEERLPDPDLEEYLCVGREELAASLDAQLPTLRLLVVTGIAGVGKTVFAENLARRWQDTYKQCLPINFEVRPDASFAEVAAESLSRLHNCPAIDIPVSPEQLLEQWLEVLATYPCLVIMDSLENLLRGYELKGWSTFREPYWEEFFHRLLGLEQCASKVIITSQDVLGQVEVHGLRYRDRYRCEQLQGLAPAAQHIFFRERGLALRPDSKAWTYLARIGAAYEGHPLSLQVIAAEVRTVCDGDVSAYWQRYGQEIEALERLQASRSLQLQPYDWRLAQGSRRLRKTVRDRIERSFSRLQSDLPDAYLVLCLTSAYSEPIAEPDLVHALVRQGWSQERSQAAIEALLDRSLLNMGCCYCLQQHNLIRSVALDRLLCFVGEAS